MISLPAASPSHRNGKDTAHAARRHDAHPLLEVLGALRALDLEGELFQVAVARGGIDAISANAGVAGEVVPDCLARQQIDVGAIAWREVGADHALHLMVLPAVFRPGRGCLAHLAVEHLLSALGLDRVVAHAGPGRRTALGRTHAAMIPRRAWRFQAHGRARSPAP
jgi:hypothetical protein